MVRIFSHRPLRQLNASFSSKHDSCNCCSSSSNPTPMGQIQMWRIIMGEMSMLVVVGVAVEVVLVLVLVLVLVAA